VIAPSSFRSLALRFSLSIFNYYLCLTPSCHLHIGNFWKPHLITDSKKVKLGLRGSPEILWFDRSLLILNGNVNKDYRLPFEMLDCKAKFKDEDFRK